MSAGKGDKPRPVDKKRYDSNYAEISWKSRPGAHPKPDADKRATADQPRR
jgi:hypothetical protein